MGKRHQLKRYTLQKLRQIYPLQTDGQTLSIIGQLVQQKKSCFNLKTRLIKILASSCKKIDKQNYQANERSFLNLFQQAVRDRLAKKQKLVMDKSSRPTEQDIKSLTELFEYMQKQGQIIDRNNKDIDKVIVMKQEHLKKLKIPQENHMQKIFDQMDKEYIRLNEQCSKQTTKLSAKSADLSSFKQRIVNIQADIEQSRVAYQSVESAVRQKQRQLDHLTTYFRNRTREDQDNIDRQRKLSTLLEAQLLKAQKIVNFSKNTNEQLKITQAEFLTSKSKQI